MYTINRRTFDGTTVTHEATGDTIHPTIAYAHAELDRLYRLCVPYFDVIRSSGGTLTVRHHDGVQVCVHQVVRAGR
jgi:hypothetical protein